MIKMEQTAKNTAVQNNTPENESAYKQAGVDIDTAADLVESIKPAVSKTKRSGVVGGLGGFGALFDPKAAGYDDPILVSATDGVGTKLRIAIDCETHNTIGIDLVAMCANDLVVQGAEPLFFLDYFATGKLNKQAGKDVIDGIAKGCEIAGCALIGGEIAEMPGMYAQGDYDLAGFTVGAVNRDQLITGQAIKAGDSILALASNGLHSNGFSLVRKIFNESDYKYDDALPFNMLVRHQDQTIEKQVSVHAETFVEALLAPTRIYVRSILKALEVKDNEGTPAIKGIAHITGGGLSENIPRILPEGLAASMDAMRWEMPEIFKWLKSQGNLDNDDLSRTLNCGIGMIIICDPEHEQALITALSEAGETVNQVGEIVAQKQSDISFILQNRQKSWG